MALFGGILAVGLGVAWYGFSPVSENDDIVAHEHARLNTPPQVPADVAPHALQASQRSGGTSSTKAPMANTAARDIFVNEALDLQARFSDLVGRADAGDPDAKHLARHVVSECEIAHATSRETVLPEVWSRDMDVALSRMKAQCSPLESRIDYQRLRDATKNQPRDISDGDIIDGIRKAFADRGAKAAELQALEYYKMRPDPITAGVIADVWDDLGITTYDQRFVLRGSAAINPASRRDIFHSALNLLACDLDVPCGPQSEVVMALCAEHGLCAPGSNLYQLYRDRLLPGDAMQNVDSVLQVLRQLLAQ